MALNSNFYIGFTENTENSLKALEQNIDFSKFHYDCYLNTYKQAPIFKDKEDEIQKETTDILITIANFYSGYRNISSSPLNIIGDDSATITTLEPQENIFFLGRDSSNNIKYLKVPAFDIQYDFFINPIDNTLNKFEAATNYYGMQVRFPLELPRWKLEEVFQTLPFIGSKVSIPVSLSTNSYTGSGKTYRLLPWDKYNIRFLLDGKEMYVEYQDVTAQFISGRWTYTKLANREYCITLDFLSNEVRQALTNLGNRLKIQIY